jgi:hypothetical protein
LLPNFNGKKRQRARGWRTPGTLSVQRLKRWCDEPICFLSMPLDKLKFLPALLAHHILSQVIQSGPQFTGAVRTGYSNQLNLGRRIRQAEIKLLFAGNTSYSLIQVFRLDVESLLTIRTFDDVLAWLNLQPLLDFLQGEEVRNLHNAGLKVRIQQRTTILTMNEILRHMLAALWT